MPAVSKNQAIAMSIAEHNPGSLYKRNAGLKGMTHQQLHDFASTSRKGLPKSKRVKKAIPRAKVTVGNLMGHEAEEDEDDEG